MCVTSGLVMFPSGFGTARALEMVVHSKLCTASHLTDSVGHITKQYHHHRHTYSSFIFSPLVAATVEISSEDPEHDWQFVPRRGVDGSVDREVETVLGAADSHLPLVEVAVLGALHLQVLAGVPHLGPPTGRLGRGEPGPEDDIRGQHLYLSHLSDPVGGAAKGIPW